MSGLLCAVCTWGKERGEPRCLFLLQVYTARRSSTETLPYKLHNKPLLPHMAKSLQHVRAHFSDHGAPNASTLLANARQNLG